MELALTPPAAAALAPAALMAATALLALWPAGDAVRAWRRFLVASLLGTALAGVALVAGSGRITLPTALAASNTGLAIALLVQVLGTVIAAFSSRYLRGEPGQPRYVQALAAVLAAVHVLLLANHWALLIGAWAVVGSALQSLLCFYPDRPFALLAAHKKRLADRAADMLLLAAAALAWHAVGSLYLSDMWAHLERTGASLPLQASAVCLVLAVVLRTASLPVHGWLVQVMEAPTPVSALLHAGVVNLGGFVLIRFAPLLDQAPVAQALLVLFGLGTAVLAGLVMLTRISIKVRLAWSTVAQMGFMLMECGLGLYTLAALHLIGHSLYKAHTFLAASAVVRQGRLDALAVPARPATWAVVAAPAVAALAVVGVQQAVGALTGWAAWPWWWSLVLALAWAPLLWVPAAGGDATGRAGQAGFGLLALCGLAAAAALAHALPFGIADAPRTGLGLVALAGLAALYACQATVQLRPQALTAWRRRSYAGFYLDEAYTRLALRLWPAAWTPAAGNPAARPAPANPSPPPTGARP